MDNLHPQIRAMLQEQEKLGGVDLTKLAIGTKIEIQTRNSIYKIEVLSDNKYMAQGGKKFPVPTEMRISGSTWGGSMIKTKWLGLGMNMEVHYNEPDRIMNRFLTTTAIESIKIIAPDESWAYKL